MSELQQAFADLRLVNVARAALGLAAYRLPPVIRRRCLAHGGIERTRIEQVFQ